MTENTKLIFFQLLNRNLTTKEFEQWIYINNEQLEVELQNELYFKLISLDYNLKSSLSQLTDYVKTNIDTEEFNIWKVKRFLTELLDNKFDLVTATSKLKSLYYETDKKLIPIGLGLGYESELDDFPTPSEYHLWNRKVLNEKLKEVDSYKEDLFRDAKECLDLLNKK